MHHGMSRPAAARATSRHIVDEEAAELTLRALARLGHPAAARELSRAIRDHFGATASPSRVYVAIGQLWERGYVTVQPMRIQRGGRSTRQTVITITSRGRVAAAAIADELREAEDEARRARSAAAPDSGRRRR
jgi:hypothetical protein